MQECLTLASESCSQSLLRTSGPFLAWGPACYWQAFPQGFKVCPEIKLELLCMTGFRLSWPTEGRPTPWIPGGHDPLAVGPTLSDCTLDRVLDPFLPKPCCNLDPELAFMDDSSYSALRPELPQMVVLVVLLSSLSARVTTSPLPMKKF